MKKAAALRALLQKPDLVIAPGAFDGMTARLVEQAGYQAVYMTGAGTSITKGFPDFGLLGMSEMVENARVMTRSTALPLISDADTGYGNELNVTRTVREFEAEGVAAIHTPENEAIAFAIDPLRREMLLEGLDEIGLTLKSSDTIAAWQTDDRARRPWVWSVEERAR
jgi:isocitrate lyase